MDHELISAEESFTLADFFRLLYQDSVGFIYVGTKNPNEPDKFKAWKQKFFEYPNQLGDTVRYIEQNTAQYEVYTGPALFAEESSQKTSVAEARVVWCEFDGIIPTELNGLPEPSIKIVSSHDNEREHWYWLLDAPIDLETVEAINRGITYELNADYSGWDGNQVLRPPGTLNHKRERKTYIKHLSLERYGLDAFTDIKKPPPLIEDLHLQELPAIHDIINKYTIPEGPWSLFTQGVKVGSRSDGLVVLAYYMAELGMTNSEIYVVIDNADKRWGKFKDRADRERRLSEIVTKARAKYPLSYTTEVTRYESLGFRSLLALDIKVEWVLQGLLQRAGYMLVTGPSGVGKTQFALSLAEHMALEKTFLGRSCTRSRVGVFSLEMGVADLKEFVETQSKFFSEEELNILEEYVRFFPLGEPIYLNQESEKARIEEVIKREGLDGIIVDSLGSTTEGSLSEETAIKGLMDWNDRLRNRTGVFTVYIHHHRKATGENKKPNKLADVYGSHYITSRATTVLSLWPGSSDGEIEANPLKIRLIKKISPFKIYRTPELQFVASQPDVKKVVDKLVSQVTKEAEKTSMVSFITAPTEEDKKGPGGSFGI